MDRPISPQMAYHYFEQYPELMNGRSFAFLIAYLKQGKLEPVECGADSGIDPEIFGALIKNPKNRKLSGANRAFLFRRPGREALYGYCDPSDGMHHWGILLDESTGLLLYVLDPSEDTIMQDPAGQKKHWLRKKRSPSDDPNEKSVS